jgi:lactate dehydrogenase-like 2-hydroxyacid dehydrogenase
MMAKHLLTKEQRAAGLDTYEDEHFVYILDTRTSKVVAVFSAAGAAIEAIQQAAEDYLKERS